MGPWEGRHKNQLLYKFFTHLAAAYYNDQKQFFFFNFKPFEIGVHVKLDGSLDSSKFCIYLTH